MVAVVDTFPIDLTAVDVIGEGSFQYVFYLNIFDGAPLHRQKVIVFVHFAPVDDLTQLDFEHLIEPDASGASCTKKCEK